MIPLWRNLWGVIPDRLRSSVNDRLILSKGNTLTARTAGQLQLLIKEGEVQAPGNRSSMSGTITFTAIFLQTSNMHRVLNENFMLACIRPVCVPEPQWCWANNIASSSCQCVWDCPSGLCDLLVLRLLCFRGSGREHVHMEWRIVWNLLGACGVLKNNRREVRALTESFWLSFVSLGCNYSDARWN